MLVVGLTRQLSVMPSWSSEASAGPPGQLPGTRAADWPQQRGGERDAAEPGRPVQWQQHQSNDDPPRADRGKDAFGDALSGALRRNAAAWIWAQLLSSHQHFSPALRVGAGRQGSVREMYRRFEEQQLPTLKEALSVQGLWMERELGLA